MKTKFKIFKPKRRACSGKTLKYPITQEKPSSWLQAGNKGFLFSSLDGYVVDKDKKVSALMSRFEFEGAYLDRHHFTDNLLDKYADELHANMILANQLKVPYRIFLWPKDFPSANQLNDREIIVYLPSMNNNKLDASNVKWINLQGLESGIKKYRGKSFESVKSLGSATSNVECYLANKTNNPWPGDLDGYITEKKNGLIKSLIEFKTHNIDAPIEKEYIGKYGKQDWRRFEVLYQLQDQIEKAQGFRPALYFIVWGTKDVTNHRKIKIDQIENGQILKTTLLSRPDFGRYSPELHDVLMSH